MEWSMTQYNLIVYGDTEDPIFTNLFGRSSFPADRLFEYTGDELKQRYQNDLKGLSELPTLVLGEFYRGQAAPAVLGHLDDIERRGANLHFRFDHWFDRLSSEEIFNCGYFDITIHASGVDERSRTHWAVKRGNLFEGLFKLLNDQSKGERPRLFSVERWPLPVLGHIAVMMPFAKEFDPVYKAIQSACTSQRFRTLRVDEIYGPTRIMDDVFSTIAQSRLVISDLTGRNPNVLYETGIAHALNREVIIIVQNDQDVPFDLGHIRHVQYLPNKEGLEKLREDLLASIRATRLREGDHQ